MVEGNPITVREAISQDGKLHVYGDLSKLMKVRYNRITYPLFQQKLQALMKQKNVDVWSFGTSDFMGFDVYFIRNNNIGHTLMVTPIFSPITPVPTIPIFLPYRSIPSIPSIE